MSTGILSKFTNCQVIENADIHISNTKEENISFTTTDGKELNPHTVFIDTLMYCGKYAYIGMKPLTEIGTGGVVYKATKLDISKEVYFRYLRALQSNPSEPLRDDLIPRDKYDEFMKKGKPVVVKFTNNVKKTSTQEIGKDALDEIYFAEWMANENIGPEIVNAFFFSFSNSPKNVMMCIVMERGNLGSFADFIDKGPTYKDFEIVVGLIEEVIQRQIEAGMICYDIKPDNFIISLNDPTKEYDEYSNPFKVRMIDFDGTHCSIDVSNFSQFDKRATISILLVQLYYMTAAMLVSFSADRTPQVYSPEQVTKFLTSFWTSGVLFPLKEELPETIREGPENLKILSNFINSNKYLDLQYDFFWYVYGWVIRDNKIPFKLTPDRFLDILLFTYGTDEAFDKKLPKRYLNDYRVKNINNYLGKTVKNTYIRAVKCFDRKLKGLTIPDECKDLDNPNKIPTTSEIRKERSPRKHTVGPLIIKEDEDRESRKLSPIQLKKSKVLDSDSPMSFFSASADMGENSLAGKIAKKLSTKTKQSDIANTVQNFIRKNIEQDFYENGRKISGDPVPPPNKIQKELINSKIPLSIKTNRGIENGRLLHYISFITASNNATTVEGVSYRSLFSKSSIISDEQFAQATTEGGKQRNIGKTARRTSSSEMSISSDISL